MDEAVRVAHDLVDTMKKLQCQERIQPGRHANALMQLSEIFQKKMINPETMGGANPQT